MSFDADAIYNLLPAIHRVRDSELGRARAESLGLPAGEGERFRPLRQLIEVIAGQAEVLEEELAQLYDNHFVETAAPWALPYLADLLGLRGVALTFAPRAEVGHTIGYRRRKGTAAVLEQLARDVTGQPARAVEFFDRLATTQQLNHLRPRNRAFTSLRNASALEYFGTPFDDSARTVEVRRIQPGRGHWNIPNVGLFLWRLRAFSLSRTPLAAAHTGGRHFRFHPLGLDTLLFNLPVMEDEATHLAEPLNVPLPITCRMLNGEPAAFDPFQFHPSPDYYGAERSLLIELWDATAKAYAGVPAGRIIVCDLEDVREADDVIVGWGHQGVATDHGVILLDPLRGRVLFDAPQTDQQHPPLGSFHYGFSANLGGGEYARSGGLEQVEGKVVRVSVQAPPTVEVKATIAAALAELGDEAGTVLIEDSACYTETLQIEASGRQVEIRAVDGARPTVILKQPLKLSGDREGSVILDGLLLAGRAIQVAEGSGDSLGHLRIRHCTLMPKLVANPDGSPAEGAVAAAITSLAPTLELELSNSILRPLRLAPRSTVRLRNCIVDSGAPEGMALSAPDDTSPSASWRLENCTIIGKCRLRVLELASNSIFLGQGKEPLIVQQRQTGCVRFCWIPPRARVPRRYHCLPGDHGPAVRPVFTSLSWSDPAYGQLHWLCPDAIRQGADDESEMGAFHDGHAARREAYCRGRLEEYLRFGLEVGLFPINTQDRLGLDFSR